MYKKNIIVAWNGGKQWYIPTLCVCVLGEGGGARERESAWEREKHSYNKRKTTLGGKLSLTEHRRSYHEQRKELDSSRSYGEWRENDGKIIGK